jgi:hypothetical protein
MSLANSLRRTLDLSEDVMDLLAYYKGQCSYPPGARLSVVKSWRLVSA